MKKTLSIVAITVALSAPAYANLTEEEVQEMLALSNESAAERIVGETSVGDPIATAKALALTNDSPAENTVNFDRARSVDVSEVQAFFALGNDSAAERIVK